MKTYLALLPIALWTAIGVCHSETPSAPTELFSNENPLELVIEMDIKRIIEDKSEHPEYSEALLIDRTDKEKNQFFNIKIKPRGRTRRVSSICEFPPLKLNFKKKSTIHSEFEGQDKIKLFSHCQESEQYQNYAMMEYLIYKTYNILTNHSYRVRLINITYRDTEKNFADIERKGYLMEDDELMAKRLNGHISDKTIWNSDSCEQKTVDILSMFQFMIGNTDWWIHTRHNIDLVSLFDETLIPIPFDFDYAGIINTPYAIPSSELPINRVKDRFFKGPCKSTDIQYYQYVIDIFNEKQPEIQAQYRNAEYLSNWNKRSFQRYIDDFYEIINNRVEFEMALEESCIFFNTAPSSAPIK